ADDALLGDLELVAEARRRKALSPDFGSEEERGFQSEVRGVQRAVGLDDSLQVGRREERARRVLEGVAEAREIGLLERQARRRGVAAEPENQSGMPQGDAVERVAQVQVGDGAPGAPDLAGVAAGECEGGPVKTVLDAPGQNADDALVP